MGTTEKLLAELAILRQEKAIMQKQLAEKEAMIDWLADKLAADCVGGNVCLADQSDISCPNPNSLCRFMSSDDWCNAAQEAVKK